MRQIKVLGLCLVAVFALAAVTASAASAAAKPLLQFESEGSPAPSGAPAELYLGLDVGKLQGCQVVVQGTLGTNPAKSVVDKESGPALSKTVKKARAMSGSLEEITWGQRQAQGEGQSRSYLPGIPGPVCL